MKRMPKYFKDTLKSIYENIYKNVLKEEYIVFLCGAKSELGKIAQRDELRTIIESDPKKFKNLRIIYAEELFKSIVTRRNEDDFLELENTLGECADRIVIFLESPGSFVELGAFTNHKLLFEKLTVITDIQFKTHESFIEQGPLKKLKRLNNSSVKYISHVDYDLAKQIVSDIKASGSSKDITNLGSLISLIYFIPIYLFFVSPVTFEDIEEHINYITNNSIEKLNVGVKSVIQYLTSKELLHKESDNGQHVYLLTEKGYNETCRSIFSYDFSSIDKHYVDKLRMAAMYYKMKHDKEYSIG